MSLIILSLNLSSYILPSPRKFWWNSLFKILLVIQSLFKSSISNLQSLGFTSIYPLAYRFHYHYMQLQIDTRSSWFNFISCLIYLHEGFFDPCWLIHTSLNNYHFHPQKNIFLSRQVPNSIPLDCFIVKFTLLQVGQEILAH